MRIHETRVKVHAVREPGMYVEANGIAAIDQAAADTGQTRSDLLRETFRVGWPLVEAQLTADRLVREGLDARSKK